MTTQTTHDEQSSHWKMILKRALQLSFLFFLLKGIAWLMVGWLAWRGIA